VLKSRSLVLFASRQINRPDARLEVCCQRSEHSGPSCSWRRFRLETVHLHGRGLETQTFLLVREELLNILALIALELDDLTMVPLQANFFLITLRIFFWSNFFGRPWTVVKVLRPLRSAWGCQRVSAVGGCCLEEATYAGYGCGCSSETASRYRRLHPLRRTGL
jgi:hypothetical protein